MLLVYYTQSKIMREEGMFMFGIYYYYRNLILLAVVPAIILLVKVYQKDKVEKESPKMLVTLIMCGIFSAFPALLVEMAALRLSMGHVQLMELLLSPQSAESKERIR